MNNRGHYAHRLTEAAADTAPATPLAEAVARLWDSDMAARTWLTRAARLPPSTVVKGGSFDALTGTDRAELLAAAAAVLSIALRLSREIAEPSV